MRACPCGKPLTTRYQVTYCSRRCSRLYAKKQPPAAPDHPWRNLGTIDVRRA